MKKTLQIKLFGELEVKVVVKSNLDGTFLVESEDHNMLAYFQEFIDDVVSKNSELFLTVSESAQSGKVIIDKTVQNKVGVKDEEYLDALCDYLNKNIFEYQGVRFFAYINES